MSYFSFIFVSPLRADSLYFIDFDDVEYGLDRLFSATVKCLALLGLRLVLYLFPDGNGPG
ncbi:MAG: hypothetical protein LBQ79_14970 [Deltaproteobacteria bacterium]|jgi:hypothetical protein|nr:hypothetical protein [Deltaproteobacteria bacterium]